MRPHKEGSVDKAIQEQDQIQIAKNRWSRCDFALKDDKTVPGRQLYQNAISDRFFIVRNLSNPPTPNPFGRDTSQGPSGLGSVSNCTAPHLDNVSYTNKRGYCNFIKREDNLNFQQNTPLESTSSSSTTPTFLLSIFPT